MKKYYSVTVSSEDKVVVKHNLGYMPSVGTYNEDGDDLIFGAPIHEDIQLMGCIRHESVNQLTIDFGRKVTGNIVCS